MRLLVYMAFRSILRSKLSLALLLLAVAAGVALQIPNAANLNGYSAEIVRLTIERATGHVQVSARGAEPLAGVSKTRGALRRLPFVRGVAPRIIHFGVLYRGENYRATRVMGLDPKLEDRLAGLCERVEHGRCMKPSGNGEAMVGEKLARQLEIKVGDRVRLVAPYMDLGEVEYAREAFTVVGIMEGGGGFSEDKDLLLHIGELSRMIDYEDEATVLAIHVKDHRKVDQYAAAVRKVVQRGQVQTFWQAYDFVSDVVQGNRRLMLISLIMVIVAVGIPVLAMLYIHVLRERRQIAVLASLGFSGRDLFVIYLLQAVLVGLLGCGLGVAGGLALCRVFEAYPIFQSEGFVVRPLLTHWVIGLPVATVFFVTLLAGLVPAVRATRANPTLVLRGQ